MFCCSLQELKTRALAAQALVSDIRRVILDCAYLRGLTLAESKEKGMRLTFCFTLQLSDQLSSMDPPC